MSVLGKLILERRYQPDETIVIQNGADTMLFTPPIGEDYWQYRVRVTDGQAVIGFPKFGTIGIGFAVEDYDWNTNLPYTTDAPDIARHIWENRAPLPDDVPTFDLVVRAIQMIQQAATEDHHG